MNNVVIIGGGVAAVNAIKAIREYNREINIHIIQNENYYPYYRTRLTKSLFDDLDINKILLQKEEWYEQNNVMLSLGKEAIALDTEKQIITLAGGKTIEYDTLILANGAHNFIPQIEGIDKEGVFSIRTFADIQIIKKSSADKSTLLCIGGGIQNLETAWAFCQRGKKVIIAEFMDRLMPRQLDQRGSEILKMAVDNHNLQILLNTQITQITGDKKAAGALTKDGLPLACDTVIYSVGVRSNLKLYENTALTINRGVLVNNRMQTNIENIYAAGDIAELAGMVGGLWPVAIEQGKIAGYNVIGKDVVYSGVVPVTNMNAFNLSVFSVGTVDETQCTTTLTEDSGDGQSYKRIFLQNNTIIGAIVIGETKMNNLLKKFVENKTVLPELDLAYLSVNELLVQLKNI